MKARLVLMLWGTLLGGITGLASGWSQWETGVFALLLNVMMLIGYTDTKEDTA